MKIGILTLHFSHNSGAVLQAYALQKTLAERGHDVYVIDYIPKYIDKNQYKKYKIVPNNKQLPLKKKLEISFRLIYNFFAIANRITAYENFLYNKLKLTGKVKKEELKSLDFDAYILGSDQIWNEEITNGFEDAYFGEFVDKNKSKIIAYSASLGGNKINDEKEFKRLLEKLDKIAVREQESVDFLSRYTNKEIVNTLDPTLLIPREEWEKDFCLKDNPKNYILFFALLQRKHDAAFDFAKNIAKQKKLRIVLFVSFKNVNKFKKIVNTPYNFLNLIKNSKYIITDSFHGVVFSIIFKKEFYVIKRDCDKIGKTNSSFRIENLLNKLNIKGRIIGETIEEINYDNVHNILKLERDKSIMYVVDALKDKAL